MNQDTQDLGWRDHRWPLAAALVYFGALLVYAWLHDASPKREAQPVTTPQAYYEREKAQPPAPADSTPPIPTP